MARPALWLLTAIVLIGPLPAGAADVRVMGRDPAVVIVDEAPPVVAEVVPETGPMLPPPQVRYGCQRVWRCDTTVCEWRRGCWGVYGYVEGPYYTSTFARRQWENHGLPGRYSRRPYP